MAKECQTVQSLTEVNMFMFMTESYSNVFITQVNLCIFSSAMDVFERNVFELSNCKHASASVLYLKLLTGPQVLNALEQSLSK